MLPRNETVVPVQQPRLPTVNKIAPYLERIDASRIYSNFGPLNTELERRLSEMLGLPSVQVVSASSATLALQGAVATSPNDGGETWEIPSWTFTATASSVLQAGKEIKFVDVDKEWRAEFTNGAQGAIDVLPFGLNPEFSRSRFSTNFVVDAAASFDALTKSDCLFSDKPVAYVLSLHATKALPAGEGGVFITNDENWGIRFRRWSNFGLNPQRTSIELGTNAKLSEYHAAVGLASLDAWNETASAWQNQMARAKILSSQFDLKPHLALERDLISPYWLVKLENPTERNRLETLATGMGIGTRRWWQDGSAKMSAYQSSKSGVLTETNDLASTVIGLPMYLDMGESEWNHVRVLLEEFRSTSET